MGVAVPRASMGIQSPKPPQNFGHGPSLVVNCYLENQVSQKIRVTPPPHPLMKSLTFYEDFDERLVNSTIIFIRTTCFNINDKLCVI